MAITKRPKAKEADIDRLIRKGGSPPTPTPRGDRPKFLQLRLPDELIARVDAALLRRLVAPSRHAWLLEAIYEKLGREEMDSAPPGKSAPAKERPLPGVHCAKCGKATASRFIGNIVGGGDEHEVCVECGAPREP